MTRADRNRYERERRAKDPARREKHAEYMRQWRRDNPEKVSDIDARSKAARADQVRAQHRRYYQANKEKRKRESAEWSRANPEKKKVTRANRRARKSGDRLTPGLAAKLYALQRGRCACCGLPLGAEYDLDHVMPLALGGLNRDENIQLLRRACNNLKRAKHPIEFMQKDRGKLL